MNRILLPLSIFVAALGGCGGDPPASDGGLLDRLAPGAYVLEGETDRGHQPPRAERLFLFVPEAGSDEPTYLRNTRWSTMTALTFAEGARLSDPIPCGCELCDGRCSVRVEADTGCAVFEYTDYVEWGPSICQDGGEQVMGTLRACPTDEVFAPELNIEGVLEPTLIDVDGRVRVSANYPLDEVADAVEVHVDGAPHTFTRTPIAPDRFMIELGTIGPGTDVAITYAGERPVAPTPPTALATTAVITDLTLESAPPDGAIDARGQPVRRGGCAAHRRRGPLPARSVRDGDRARRSGQRGGARHRARARRAADEPHRSAAGARRRIDRREHDPPRRSDLAPGAGGHGARVAPAHQRASHPGPERLRRLRGAPHRRARVALKPGRSLGVREEPAPRRHAAPVSRSTSGFEMAAAGAIMDP